MKKLLFSIVLISILSPVFLSCKKDAATASATSTYYIKGKKDGTAFNFTNNTQAQTMSGSGYSIFTLSGGAGTSEGFNLGISTSGTSVQVGTYSENSTSMNYILSGVYNPNSTTIAYAAGIQTPSVKPLVINITSKTTTEVSGTFSGAFYKQDVVSGAMSSNYITITEGEFKLQMK